MRRAERLFRLVDELRTRHVTRAEDLARVMEVHVRTIYRDIAHLQASGLPIDGAAGVGYLLRPGFNLPSLTLTHDQIDALAVGLSYVERTGDPVLAAAARETRAKIQAGLPSPEKRSLADAPYFTMVPASGPPVHGATIRAAIRESRVVELDYADGAGKPTVRRVRPLALWTLPDGSMFTGWCELRGDFRTFRLDRIVGLVVTGERFEETPETRLRTFMEREKCGAPAPMHDGIGPLPGQNAPEPARFVQ